ncbi:hypothetical protein ONS95_002061 [Cadophora gregata]|uniref:uncharacterized protein n=1 Tax=Cadophora gregata TaxID=51156 RepID=UPI0026DB2033|nr:uncharacterized protein ONS95_002061 [Cadophora gregata]KAK0111720.1 hypothetical protein ONS95_002061 [Cadophora gregata]
MSVKGAIVLSLGLLASLVSAAPTVATASTYDTNLLWFLENVDPNEVEITPGPGLSQAVNISSHDLFDIDWRAKNGLPDPRTSSPVARSLFEKRVNLQCWYDNSRGNMQGAYSNHDYLMAIGNQGVQCNVYGQWVLQNFYSATAYGVRTTADGLANTGSSASSNCADVARGLEPIMESCHPSCFSRWSPKHCAPHNLPS